MHPLDLKQFQTHLEDVNVIIEINGKADEKKPSFFTFKPDDIKVEKPEAVKLVLNQYTKDM